MSKNLKKIIRPIDQLKIIALCLIALLIILSIIAVTKKEKTDDSQEKVLNTEIAQNGEFIFETTEKSKTFTFKIINDSKNVKNYNLGLTHLSNALENFSSLTYDLWINDTEEIYNEIFPKEDMLLLDGASIDANKTLEIKLVLKYEIREGESKEIQTIRGKINIEED